MKIKKVVLLIIAVFALQTLAFAQDKTKQYWFFWSHGQQLNEKFDLLFDAQGRSEEKLGQFQTLLLRSALAYNFDKFHSLAIGYAYKGESMEDEAYTYEHRIYQQYQYEFKIKRIEFQLRGRLEERFLQESGNAFSMRTRGFVSAVFPLIADQEFTSGLYAGLQNELFLNILNQKEVNGHLFDQNRPYVSLGYRFSKKVETTFDYGLIADQAYQKRTLISVFRISLNTQF
ncbi:DUF2490 domain-containing protein [Pedobacter sp. Leaf250]|uniref:DUF2490 domain-containing protein n=1 Tax=Pedobacter sp. Leaf250 TaxID=2876559 RepID=UPI001E28D1F0|nr:DUF2490 domain-containing protein [Pedobacter sp. Leaf250]